MTDEACLLNQLEKSAVGIELGGIGSKRTAVPAPNLQGRKLRP